MRLYLGTSFGFSTATFLIAAALGKHVYDLTDSELALGMLGLAEFLPAILLLPLTGPAADRFDRRWVGSLAVVSNTIVAIGMALYALTDPTSATPLFGFAALYGVGRAFSRPAVRAIPPLLVQPASLARLIPLNSSMMQAGIVLGPATSGFLYDVDTAVPYIVAAVLFGVGAVCLVVIRTVREQDRTVGASTRSWHQAVEGLRYIRGQRILLGAISLDLFAVLFGGAVALLPAIAEDRLHVGNVAYGWLRAAPGIGAVLLTVAMAIWPIGRHVGKALLVCVGIFGVGTIALGFTTNFVVAFVALVVLAGADAISVFVRGVIVPLATPDRMRGRVMSVDAVFIGASNEVGAFESGVTAAAFGVGPAVVLGGALTLVVVGVYWFGFTSLRDVDRFDDINVDHHEARAADRTASSVPP